MSKERGLSDSSDVKFKERVNCDGQPVKISASLIDVQQGEFSVLSRSFADSRSLIGPMEQT
jgi:hypothetical protein